MNISTAKSRLALPALGVLALTLSACASSGAAYKPIIDGPITASYNSDLAQCRQVAEQRDYMNADVRTSAAVGAGLGGLIGLVDSDGGGVEDFIGGALVGGLLGGGSETFETRKERKQIVLNCMSGRGHRVVG